MKSYTLAKIFKMLQVPQKLATGLSYQEQLNFQNYRTNKLRTET